MATDEELRRCFSSGNYCNAYETEDYATALERRPHAPDVRAAFMLGFFATYELHEIPSEHREVYDEAYWSAGGRRCVALGLIDERTEDES